MRFVAIIQARMGSTRFPGKVLAELDGRPLIDCVISSTARGICLAGRGDFLSVIVAIPRWGNDALALHCDRSSIPFWYDDCPESDVLSRFVNAISTFTSATHVVRICGDNPALCPYLMCRLVETARATQADYWGYEYEPGIPAITKRLGTVCEVVTVEALKHANRITPANSKYREHVTAPIYKKPETFKLHWEPLPEQYKNLFLAVDTPEDLTHVRRHYARH